MRDHDDIDEDDQLNIKAKRRLVARSVPIYHETSSDEDFCSSFDEDFKLHYSMDSSFSSNYSDPLNESNDLNQSRETDGSDSPSCSSERTTHDTSNSNDNDSMKSADILNPPVSSKQSNSSTGLTRTSRSNSVNQDEEVEYEMVPGKRMGSLLLYSLNESIFYKKNSKSSTGVSYSCYQTDCRARVLLKTNGICVRKSGDHLHSTHEIIYKQLEAEHRVKNLCLNDRSSKTTKEIYEDILIEHQDLEKPYSKMQRNLRLLRSKSLPQSPLDCSGIDIAFARSDIMEKFGFSKHQSKREKFFHGTVSNRSFSFCVFASINTIKLIQENVRPTKRVILMDATFKIVPISCFTQILIIHAQYNNKIYPMIYVLMSRKSQDCYTAVFKYINEKIFFLRCRTFITDFERAMRNALRNTYPESSLTSCWFHFCQAIKRKVSQTPRLFELIRRNTNAAFIYRQFQCLPLLPEKEIVTTFNKLRSIAENFNKKAFSSFVKYYKQQWLVKEGPSKICLFKKETKTTGAAEAYNGVIGKKMKAHAPFFVFVEALQKEEFSKSTQLMQDIPLLENRRQRKERADRINRLNKASDEVEQEMITPLQFLEKVANLNNKIMKSSPMDEEPQFLDEIVDSTDSESEDDAETEDSLCVICIRKQASVLFMPCSHCCVCTECWNKRLELVTRKSLKCPRIGCNRSVKKNTIITLES